MEKEEGLGLEITELRLGLPGGGSSVDTKKRVFSEIFTSDENSSSSEKDQNNNNNKTQIVGWPPVNSYRKKNNSTAAAQTHETLKLYVKVSMDGAPFLRKIDLKTHKGYSDLALAFQHLFGCHGIEYIPIYEDKDGDWMLVGDVPWELFTESCRRLRIMKQSDAKGFGVQFKQADGETHADDDDDLKL